MKGNFDIKSVYFLGIGGIGMSALARYFKSAGVSVSGYDKTPSSITDELEIEGIKTHFTDDISQIPKDTDLVVYTPAIPNTLNEYQYIKKQKFPLLKRSEVLGLITENKNTLAIAGTHGKTTTTALVSHLLNSAKIEINSFIGGVAVNFNSNIVLSPNSNIFVVEADEFDRSFLTLNPNFAIITSVDADHLDIYGSKQQLIESFKLFTSQVKDLLIVNEKIKDNFLGNKYTYSLNSKTADFYAENIQIIYGYYYFDLITPKNEIRNLKFGIAGLHNIENAIAASALVLQNGVSEADLRLGLETFLGVHRRFEFIIRTPNLILIDDYAHHPAEIEACLNSVKQMFPDKEITAIFQPHLYTRTRDFGDDFAQSLEIADKILLLDIYPARELPIEGISSTWLLNKINSKNKKHIQKENILEEIKKTNPQIIVIMGAGDIDRLVSIVKNNFQNTI